MTEAATTPQLSLSELSDGLAKLQLTRRYYADAVRFIHQIHTAIPTLCQLLASTTKSEVIEAIEFFETAYIYTRIYPTFPLSHSLPLFRPPSPPSLSFFFLSFL